MIEPAAKQLLETCLKLKDTYPIQTKEQEQEMTEKCAGDRAKLNELLFMHNIRIAFSMAKKYSKGSRSYEDVLHDALEGLAVGAARFEPERGNKFSTVATIWVFKYISREWYKQERMISDKSFSLSAAMSSADQGSSPSSNEDKSFTNLINRAVSPDSYMSKIPGRQDHAKSIELLSLGDSLDSYVMGAGKFSEFDKTFYEKVFRDGMSVSAVSADMGITERDAFTKKLELRSELQEFLKKRHGIRHVSDVC